MRALSLLLLSACCLAQPAHADAPARDDATIRERAAEVQRTNADLALGGAERAQRVLSAYRALAAARRYEALGDASDDDLRRLFDVAYAAVFYANVDDALVDLRAAFDALDRRRLTGERETRRLYGAYIATREFELAKAFGARHAVPKAEAIPTVRDRRRAGDTGPTVLAVDATRAELRRETVRVPSGGYVIVVSHPACHFTQQAVAAIERSPTLRRVFASASRWIAPPDVTLSIAAFQAWNAQHPTTPIALAYRQAEWPLVDGWETPTFTFLSNGVVVRRVVGWPGDEQVEALVRAAEVVGLQD